METLLPAAPTYTVVERANRIYNGVLDIFDYNTSNDVTTPLSLAREQVRQIPGRSGNVLIPGAGIGTYVLACLLEGFTPEQITAIECDRAYSRLGFGIFTRFGVTYLTTDYLTFNPDMKFDVIVGNPPFQETTEKGRKDQASNLWSKFWIKSLELAKDDGYVSLITPTSWMSPSANLRGNYKFLGKNRLWDVFSSYSSVAQVTGVADYFKGIGSSFGVVTVNKGGQEGLTFQEGYSSSLGFLPKSGVEEVMIKMGSESTLENHFSVNQDCSSGWRVSVPITRKVTAQSIEILKDNEIPVSGSAKPGLYLYTHVSSEKEAIDVRRTILNCTDILNTHCRWSGFMSIKAFKMLNYTP